MRNVRVESLVDYIEVIAGLADSAVYYRGAKDPADPSAICGPVIGERIGMGTSRAGAVNARASITARGEAPLGGTTSSGFGTSDDLMASPIVELARALSIDMMGRAGSTTPVSGVSTGWPSAAGVCGTVDVLDEPIACMERI